jgi:uncharacterized protein YjdB
MEKYDPIVWSSENEAVASVNATGQVKAVSSGTTNIKAVSGAVSATVPVTVKIIASIKITPNSAEIEAGSKKDFNAVVTDDKGGVVTGEKVKWSTTDALVALVNDSGNVTGVKSGTVTIKATVLTFSDTATVVVKGEPGKPTALVPQDIKKPTTLEKKDDKKDKKKDDKKKDDKKKDDKKDDGKKKLKK